MGAKRKTRQPQQNLTAKKRAFLAAVSTSCNITQAAEIAKIERQTHYDWLKSDAQYKADFVEAKERGADALESEAARRAFAGSDTLLIFLLKGARPEKYRERSEVRMPGIEAGIAEAIIAARQQHMQHIKEHGNGGSGTS